MSHLNPIEQLYQEELYNIRPKTLVILPAPWDSFPDVDQQLLSKILGSVKQSLSSVQVITRTDADADDLMLFGPSRIIAFGTELRAAGKSIQPYQTFKHNQIALLQADGLGDLDDLKKKNLWNALKEMFRV